MEDKLPGTRDPRTTKRTRGLQVEEIGDRLLRRQGWSREPPIQGERTNEKLSNV